MVNMHAWDSTSGRVTLFMKLDLLTFGNPHAKIVRVLGSLEFKEGKRGADAPVQGTASSGSVAHG